MYKKRGVKTKLAQVWIETVIYTLIGLTIIGLLLGFAKPKIDQMTDKAILANNKDSLNIINEKILDSLTAQGNQREVKLSIKKGKYVIDAEENNIYFIIEKTNLKYSELNQSIKEGDISIMTIKRQDEKYQVSLMLNYSYLNITYADKEVKKDIFSAPSPYTLLIQNKGDKQINLILK